MPTKTVPSEKTPTNGNKPGTGLVVNRVFTSNLDGQCPLDAVTWEKRTAIIQGSDGKVLFEQKDVEVPSFWSQQATNVVASKYFRRHLDSPDREYSARQLITRVADTIRTWGVKDGYFDVDTSVVFYDELVYLLLHQYGAFNSPVWFNVGVNACPQTSACFLNSVEDNMDSIMALASIEASLFKHGSGSGVNLSVLRGSMETLTGGGVASGPVSFMRGYDAFAGVIRSGGKVRRAAKLVSLDIDHPDILDFINCKVKEEKKACALVEAGYSGDFSNLDGAYSSVFFQNGNNSIRVSDAFMQAVVDDKDWSTTFRTDGRIANTYKAKDILRAAAEATHICGDPGIQYDDTINQWHTCSNSGRIIVANPCIEYNFLCDSACNLASLNLLKFRKPDGAFDIDGFIQACRIFIVAQDILVDNSSYPTEKIAENSHKFRPLGLGYANLGALLMSYGLPYDSDEGRDLAAAITALMTGAAYYQSVYMAEVLGEFEECGRNKEPMFQVLKKHATAIPTGDYLFSSTLSTKIWDGAASLWGEVVNKFTVYGARNAQSSCLAPTGTIAFMMDCDTTGVEPDTSLVKYKTLVGGGLLRMVNSVVPLALKTLGYSDDQIQVITRYIEEKDTIEGAPGLKDEHLPVFDCAYLSPSGTRVIHYSGHLKMLQAIQPFISGAISKTVSLPNNVTVEEIEQIYIDAWKMGIKAVALYRDGSKRSQPLSTGKKEEKAIEPPAPKPYRRRLPDERQSLTHRFVIGDYKGYLTVGLYEDGAPGEIFITMSKEGSTISGLMDCFATSVSMALQYGVPLQVLCNKFSHSRFEPSGWTRHPEISYAKSIVDYIFRWMAIKFLSQEDQPTAPTQLLGISDEEIQAEAKKVAEDTHTTGQVFQGDAPLCPECGSIMVRAGACYRCMNCGGTSGCG